MFHSKLFAGGLVAKSHPILCDPMDCSPPGSSVPKQEYLSGLPFLTPGDLPDPRIEPGSPELEGSSASSKLEVYCWATREDLTNYTST